MSLKDEQEKFREEQAEIQFERRAVMRKVWTFKDGFDAAFDAYESSPKYKKMIEILKVAAEGETFGNGISAADELLKEIGEG